VNRTPSPAHGQVVRLGNDRLGDTQAGSGFLDSRGCIGPFGGLVHRFDAIGQFGQLVIDLLLAFLVSSVAFKFQLKID
jgi:hypothetical protein